jgi:hypothetical protein
VAYRSCARYAHLRRQTVAALEALADLAERQDRALALRVRRLTPLAQDPRG